MGTDSKARTPPRRRAAGTARAKSTPAPAVDKTAADALAGRLRAALPARETSERRMFGGVYFLVDGNMTAGVSRRGMLVRVGKERQDDAVKRGARLADMKGRPMEGYVRVDPAGLSDAALRDWVRLALEFARTLPPRPDEKRQPAKRKPAK